VVAGVSYGFSEQGGRVREAPGAPSGTGHGGRQLWPVVWCSGRWSGARTGGLVLGGGLVLKGGRVLRGGLGHQRWPHHDGGVASAASECSASASMGLGGSTTSKGSEVVAVCA
jgi:hypothetical protein